jgi:hypothetical protein
MQEIMDIWVNMANLSNNTKKSLTPSNSKSFWIIFPKKVLKIGGFFKEKLYNRKTVYNISNQFLV